MSKMIIVAVDGPAGSGKSSVSKDVAKRCSLQYIDSGAIYRSITWIVLNEKDKVEQGMNFVHIISSKTIKQEFLPSGESKTWVDDIDVSSLIRDEKITKNIGIISDDTAVRSYVNELLRSWAGSNSVIMDGRDIGSVVFPNAQIKIFIDASVDERAERRIKEYHEMGKNVDENAIKNQIIQRDKEDYSRPVGTLVQVEDAHYLDTSYMTKEEVINKIETIINPVKQ
ncbi:MAG: (d)CMP kinase [Spirochaetaceae bacterium]|jgi:cytidylate kinase|nr:(d)CMP kinase [Spirochaetaceae bacterium]